MKLLLTAHRALGVAVFGVLCSFSAWAQDARTLRAQAETESNQEKQVMLLCKAADLDPKNKEFRRDCDVSRSALISADRQALKTAQDASDSGQPVKARRYAKYVSSLDPELHKQAEQLLAKIDTAATSSSATVAATQSTGSSQNALLSQATIAYQSGNLAAAKAAAQSITDASLRPAANQLVTDIDRYSGLVSAGQRHEQAKEYGAAESSYQSALALNPHVTADDLANKVRALHQMSSTAAKNDVPSMPAKAPNTQSGKQNATPPSPVLSTQDKVKTLLDRAVSLKSHNDPSGAGKLCRQVLELDHTNVDAQHCIDDITAELNKDPVKLEKTLREAIVAFYASRFEDAESGLNQYIGAGSAKKKGAAYFYLGASAATRAFLEDASKRASRTHQAEGDFKQARLDGYQPVEKYVSARVLEIWKNSGL